MEKECNCLQDVKQWLNGPGEWATGVALVLKYTTDKALHQAFSEKPTPYKIKRLRQELASIIEAGNTPAPPAPGGQEITQEPPPAPPAPGGQEITQEPPPAPPAPGGWGHPGQMDATVNALWLQWKPLFSELNNLSSRIYEIALLGTKDQAAKQEAGQMAFRILDLEQRCQELYVKRDTYIQTGTLPGEPEIENNIVVDPKKIPTALDNAKRYVRQYKNKLKKSPQDEKAAEKLKQWEKMVSYYESKID